jgi:ribosomal protein S18 acetylase RimI-like enzyme
MTVRYEFTSRVPLDEVARLFAQTYWTRKRTAPQIEAMIDHSPVCLAAWDGERLVGFARAVTDDIFRAMIDDVIVDTAYHGQGVGTEMMRQMLARLAHVEEVVVDCDDEVIPFYERFGFERMDSTLLHIWRGGAQERLTEARGG